MAKTSLGLGISWLRFFGGLMGGGKSYFAVQQIAHILSLGGSVCTNIKIKREGMRALILHRHGVDVGEDIPGLHLWDNATDAWTIANFTDHVPAGSPTVRSLVVIDEAHDYFPAGRDDVVFPCTAPPLDLPPYGRLEYEWDPEDPEADSCAPRGKHVVGVALPAVKHCAKITAWLRKCRHQYTEVILISQNAQSVSAAIRKLCHYWTFRDLGTLKILGIRCPSRLIAIERMPDKNGEGKGEKMQAFNQGKDPRVFAAYESTQYAASGPVAEKQAVQRVGRGWKIKKRYVLIAAVVGWWVWKEAQPGLMDSTPAPAASKPPKIEPVPARSATARQNAAAVREKFAIINARGIRPFRDGFRHWLSFDAYPPNQHAETVFVGDWSNNLEGRIVSLNRDTLTVETIHGTSHARIVHRPFRVLPGSGPASVQAGDLGNRPAFPVVNGFQSGEGLSP